MAENHHMFTDTYVRPALRADSANLALLADMATRGLSTFLWGLAAKSGQTPLDLGGTSIGDDAGSLLYYPNWQVAERGNDLVGAVYGYVLGHQPVATDPRAAQVLQPLCDLKNLAIGSWYISALAVFPQARGGRVGHSLLRQSEHLAVKASAPEITLMVGSFNTGARALHESLGYLERARQAFVPFAGSDGGGHWIFMAKSLGLGE
jgi:ribosomal protein S18 acetylase RimI-like enzyme